MSTKNSQWIGSIMHCMGLHIGLHLKINLNLLRLTFPPLIINYWHNAHKSCRKVFRHTIRIPGHNDWSFKELRHHKITNTEYWLEGCVQSCGWRKRTGMKEKIRHGANGRLCAQTLVGLMLKITFNFKAGSDGREDSTMRTWLSDRIPGTYICH